MSHQPPAPVVINGSRDWIMIPGTLRALNVSELRSSEDMHVIPADREPIQQEQNPTPQGSPSTPTAAPQFLHWVPKWCKCSLPREMRSVQSRGQRRLRCWKAEFLSAQGLAHPRSQQGLGAAGCCSTLLKANPSHHSGNSTERRAAEPGPRAYRGRT